MAVEELERRTDRPRLPILGLKGEGDMNWHDKSIECYDDKYEI